MKYLHELFNEVSDKEWLDVPIYSLCYDSRKASLNSLFFAIKGFKVDGNNFVKNAVEKGAVAIVSEKKPSLELEGIFWKQVEDIRESMALISYKFYKEALDKLFLIGVTGTNGKTTTSYIIEHIINRSGNECGLVGTLGMKGIKSINVSGLTTPESIDLHQYFADLVSNGINYAVMEVSSHAIALKRIYYLPFKLGIFTNLTRDHLDFHKTVECYFETKKKFFMKEEGIEVKIALINADDEYGKIVIKERRKLGLDTYSYGFDSSSDYRCLNYVIDGRGIRMKVDFKGKELTFDSNLLGFPNVYNILASAAASDLIGISSDIIQEAIAEFRGVKGRYEKVDYGQKFLVIIDYAHTEDAIENLLRMVRGIGKGKVIIVFGCGGDRDQGKRKLMGRAAAKYADYIIITSDNPRSENPLQIIDMILEGIKEKSNPPEYEVIVDREEAINRAIEIAADDDIVVLAGKGHENYQIIGTEKLYFDEREIVKKAIERFKK